MGKITRKLPSISQEESIKLWGGSDEHLREIEGEFDIRIIGRGNKLSIQGKEKDVKQAITVIEKVLKQIRDGGKVDENEIKELSSRLKEGKKGKITKIEVFSGRNIRAKNEAQERYMKEILNSDIVFSIGPAGTGKTYLAMAMAVSFLKEKKVNRIILVRPAVEAGEKLGFLPGDLYQKISPYLRPLYDALYDMIEADRLKEYLERGIIEIAPLAYMRGRTFNDSFIVLDEAQNSTPEQMKMFLTRLGFDSRVVITGDITQIDLPRGTISGLVQAKNILKEIKGINFVYFTEKDVVRHPLVQEIVKAYEKAKISEKG